MTIFLYSNFYGLSDHILSLRFVIVLSVSCYEYAVKGQVSANKRTKDNK